MPVLSTMNYDNLFAGDFPVSTDPVVIGAEQDIKRGDVLIESSGSYVRPTGAVIATNDVVVASEDVETGEGETAVSIGYRTGEFNEYKLRFGGSSTAAQNKAVLAGKSIYLKKAQKA